MRVRAWEDKNKGNYIRDDTAIQNNKDYLNQQHQQLARQSTPCRAQGISCKCQQVYKSQNKKDNKDNYTPNGEDNIDNAREN